MPRRSCLLKGKCMCWSAFPEGLTTSQTGARLFISENTVKTHIRHILEKLEAGNRAEAVARAAQLGLLRTKD